VNEIRDRLLRAAEWVTNEMLTNAWRETEYSPEAFRVTDVVHIEICWAHKKLCKVQCLKMYRFVQCASCLKIHVLFYCHARSAFSKFVHTSRKGVNRNQYNKLYIL
jgi:hypothetical protein